MKRVLSAFAFMALVVVGLLLPAPASAAPGDNYWHANAGSSLDGTMTGGNTSIETTNAFAEAGLTADRGDVLDLDYTLGDGATCIGGAPRVFATVGGVTVNSWDQHIAEGVEAACKAQVTLPAGHVEAIGIVWDNGQEGTITVTSLKAVGDNGFTFDLGQYEVAVLDTVKAPTATEPTCDKAGTVKLPEQTGVKYTAKRTVKDGVTVSATVTAEPVFGYLIKEGVTTTWTFPVAKLTGAQCEPTKEPTTPPSTTPPTTPAQTPPASASPTASATGTPSASSSATVVPGAVGGGDSGDLPKTGVAVLGIGGAGLLLIAVGGLLFMWARRRAEGHGDVIGRHRNDGDTQVMPTI